MDIINRTYLKMYLKEIIGNEEQEQKIYDIYDYNKNNDRDYIDLCIESYIQGFSKYTVKKWLIKNVLEKVD